MYENSDSHLIQGWCSGEVAKHQSRQLSLELLLLLYLIVVALVPVLSSGLMLLSIRLLLLMMLPMGVEFFVELWNLLLRVLLLSKTPPMSLALLLHSTGLLLLRVLWVAVTQGLSVLFLPAGEELAVPMLRMMLAAMQILPMGQLIPAVAGQVRGAVDLLLVVPSLLVDELADMEGAVELVFVVLSKVLLKFEVLVDILPRIVGSPLLALSRRVPYPMQAVEKVQPHWVEWHLEEFLVEFAKFAVDSMLAPAPQLQKLELMPKDHLLLECSEMMEEASR
mmetsp:Transcript_80922/g.142765  ORF Transcript_80922/g.142765 Transcript_80922/m.142765 type:complete len:279 (+) Transcript_80922:308-1144(+)